MPPAQEAACTLALLYAAKFLLVRTDCESKKGESQEHTKWDRLHQPQEKASHRG